ncbi:MAG: hypothetical protein WBB25_01750, partial [Sulfitobacter sp.]
MGLVKKVGSPLRVTAPTFAVLIFVGSGSVSLAQDYSWKEGFTGCTGTSPFIETLISKTDPEVRPLMKIGEMQAWAVKDEDGRPATALTTPDGLTIVGRIIGPQGEDITAALLATVPDPSASLVPPANAITSTPTSKDVPIVRTSPALDQLQLGAATQVIPSLNVPTPDRGFDSAPITAIEQPSADVQAGINTIFRQAGDDRIWFSAGTPNPSAPVVYMLADPECPHCQWTIDQMHNEIASGAIDLRIIPAPITGVQGFNTSLSILHAEDIPQTFMAHMTSKTRGTAAVAQMDTAQADKAVIQGLV